MDDIILNSTKSLISGKIKHEQDVTQLSQTQDKLIKFSYQFKIVKMTTLSRKLWHSTKASLTVFISEMERGGVQILLISMFCNIL